MRTHTGTMTSLSALSRLIRLPLSAMVSLSAVTGALAAALSTGLQMSWIGLWALAWGIFLMSAACSVLNQVQERFTDALMRRTCRRPLACGDLTARTGTLIGVILGSGGLAVLFAETGSATSLMVLSATGWYLLIYTPLKRVSSLAVVAGTPCGALPPLIGWMAAGGNLLDPRPLTLVLLMVLWQVPHYWLLALPDRDELKRVGFKVLPEQLSGTQLLSMSHFWILGTITATLLLPPMRLVQLPLLQGLIAGLAISFAVWTTRTLRKSVFIEKTADKLRLGLHLYLGLVLGTILLNGLLERLIF
jgi:protoheme IX farnesyltransferase